ncbi:DUF948 domain-containing protein [Pontibacillus litoralis]|uniref:General stress protein n=1 Tax=Pontibacillus litoralis JSM 072002 TaxID=1385512 RepID=A0A0A5G2C3_9BACI|nr:DUF948 domain-containing protein [Pontibacillus litoralis]KGX87251.1 hypothetical protein N784_16415 [Pontibacillus litoralis JSM 072002]
MELIYISALIIAIAFAILTLYVVKTLQHVTHTITGLDNTLADVVQKTDRITKETEQLIHQSSKLTDDVQHKVQATNSLFESLEDVGKATENIHQSLQTTKTTYDTSAKENTDTLATYIRWGETALTLYRSLKKK